jgi:hypothetical protein
MVQTPERVRGWPRRDHHQNGPKQRFCLEMVDGKCPELNP